MTAPFIIQERGEPPSQTIFISPSSSESRHGKQIWLPFSDSAVRLLSPLALSSNGTQAARRSLSGAMYGTTSTNNLVAMPFRSPSISMIIPIRMLSVSCLP